MRINVLFFQTADVDVEVSIPMCAAGAAAYREWEASPRERGKLNAVANLVSEIYAAMEGVRRLSSE